MASPTKPTSRPHGCKRASSHKPSCMPRWAHALSSTSLAMTPEVLVYIPKAGSEVCVPYTTLGDVGPLRRMAPLCCVLH
eukprot:1390200-Lingulodinium_polyedra.AAC.1